MAKSTILSAMILTLALHCGVSRGQALPKLEFDVASVRASSPRDPREEIPRSGFRSGGPGTSDPGRIAFTRVPLTVLIGDAFDLTQRQISGPDWIAEARYDIVANVPEGATRPQAMRMLQNLLAERLGLVFHTEVKRFPGYELVLAGGSPKLKESDPNGGVPAPQVGDSITTGKDGFPVLPPGVHFGRRYTNGHTRLRFVDAPVADLAHELDYRLVTEFVREGNEFYSESAPVVDKTGLTAHYDFTFEYKGSHCCPRPPKA